MLAEIVIASRLLAPVSCTPLPTCADNGNVSPCATPTPVIEWTQVPDADLKGYVLFVRMPGDLFQPVAEIPCDYFEEEGIPVYRFCRGAEFPIPLQRWCPACAPFNLYEFAVKAVDNADNLSATFSGILSVCFSPLCAPPGPCD